MHDIIIFFDNPLETIPVAIARQKGKIKIIKNFVKFYMSPDSITLGFVDAVDSLRRLNYEPTFLQKRIEILQALSIGYSKGDRPKKWKFGKFDIIGKKLSKKLVCDINKFESSEMNWTDFIPIISSSKVELIDAVDQAYNDLKKIYLINEDRIKWLENEFFIDSYFLNKQYNGILVDKIKIEKSLKELNYEKYSSLLLLERDYFIDISSAYLSDEKIDSLVLSEYKVEEKTNELCNLIQFINTEDKRIDAIAKVKECRIDYSNLIKHYTINEEQKIYPQYQTVGSSSGRIFISSPGTQYLKKSKRDIFLAREGYKIVYFDFRNFEPGIAAGLSNDKTIISYYNSGDMYLKIAEELYGNAEHRKNVKLAILATLYGMSESSLKNYFKGINSFDPKETIDLLKSFNTFQLWKDNIIQDALKEEKIVHSVYTRIFLPSKDWKVKTSALNHVIQSTGSKILKISISELHSHNINILIPMHDAILCEISETKVEEIKEFISRTMESIFKQEVVNTESKVVVSNFSS